MQFVTSSVGTDDYNGTHLVFSHMYLMLPKFIMGHFYHRRLRLHMVLGLDDVVVKILAVELY